MFAANYKWLRRSFSQYTIKKINLLIDVDPKLTEKSRVTIMVIGLPLLMRKKITKKMVDTQKKLVAELSQLECFSNNK